VLYSLQQEPAPQGELKDRWPEWAAGAERRAQAREKRAIYEEAHKGIIQKLVQERLQDPEVSGYVNRFASRSPNLTKAVVDAVAVAYRRGCRRELHGASDIQSKAFSEIVRERLGPKDDPAPGDLLTPDGLNSETIWGKWLNQESIGQFGERRQFQVFPGDPLPGYDHATITSDIQTLAPSAVFDDPHWLVGRKVSLYRIFRDVTNPDTGYNSYPAWDLQDASGYSRLWWGTVNDASAEGIEWKIKCDGPSSWLRKELNMNRPSTWDSVVINIKLSDQDGSREDLMAIDCYQVNAGAATTEYGSGSDFDPVVDLLPTSGESTDYRDVISARLASILSGAGADITWDASRDAVGTFGNEIVSVQIESGGTDPWCAVFR
jgi:hypothetical protein